jgi:DNA polymerase-4
VIPPHKVLNFIENMPLNKIPGVGKVTFEKLKSSGLHYGKDVSQSNENELISKFGKLGISLWKKCRGIDDREIKTTRVRKSVGVERTFTDDISDAETLNNFMHEKLIPELKRRSERYLDDREISKLGVKVKFKDFHQTTKEFKYHNFDDSIFNTLLNDALDRGQGKAVRLLGVHIGLGEEEYNQTQFELEFI